MTAQSALLLATRRGKLLLLLLAAAVIALRATNSRGEPVTQPSGTPAARDQVPAPELTDSR